MTPPEERNNDIRGMAASHPQKGRQKELKNGRGTQLPQKARTQINKKGGGEPGPHPERKTGVGGNQPPPSERKKERDEGWREPGHPQRERKNKESNERAARIPPERTNERRKRQPAPS